MAEADTRHGRFKTKQGGIFLAAATAAYFLSPLLPFAYIPALFVGGICLSGGVMARYDKDVLGENDWWTNFMCRKGLVTSYIFLVAVFAHAAYVDNERSWYCKELQEAVINGNDNVSFLENGRPDPHDAFTALGCKYQSRFFWF